MIVKNRDEALLVLGSLLRNNISKYKKIEESFEPGYEGDKDIRGLPYVEMGEFRVHYRG